MVKILLKTPFALVVGMVLIFGQATAAEFTVTVKNLTNGIYFTPLLITAHDGGTHLFETGSPASPALQAMAEGGDISGLSSIVGGPDRYTVIDPAGGLLPPGDMVSDVYFNTNRSRNRYLSLVAMLLPTNDGFVGLDSLRIPRIPGTYKYYLVGTMPAPRPMMNASPAAGPRAFREFQPHPAVMPAPAVPACLASMPIRWCTFIGVSSAIPTLKVVSAIWTVPSIAG